MYRKPQVTICIPTYNRLNYLMQSVNSALAQTYKNVEVIVWDDGSEVDVKNELMKKFKDKRLKVMRNVKNMGRPYTRNKLIEKARGKYILWLDDDDILAPNTISDYLRIEEAIGESIDIFYGNLKTFGKLTSVICPNDYYKNNALLAYVLFSQPGSPIPNPFVMVKKDLYNRFGKYDETFLRAQDYEFWARVWKNIRLKKIDKEVGLYRVHGENVSGFELLEADRSYESLAIRRHFHIESLLKVLSHTNNRTILMQIIGLLETYLDYTNALYYAQIIKNEKYQRSLIMKIGDEELLQIYAKKDKGVKEYLKIFKKILKLIDRGAVNKEFIENLGSLFGSSWLTFYAAAKLNATTDKKSAYLYARAAFIANPFSNKSKELMAQLGQEGEDESIRARITAVANNLESKKQEFYREFFHV